MLRLAVIVLLLANAGYWRSGHRACCARWATRAAGAVGTPAHEPADPVFETLQILKVNPSKTSSAAPPAPASTSPSQATAANDSPTPASTPAAPAPASTPAASAPADSAECLQATAVFDDRQAEALRTAAAGLPALQLDAGAHAHPRPLDGLHGRSDDIETLDRKRAELRARARDSRPRRRHRSSLGLSLGRFSSKEAAERELANLGTKGVRTARVVQERAEAPGFTLRLPAVNDALRAQLDVLRTAMAGKTLRACG